MTVRRDVVSLGEYEFSCDGSIGNLEVAYERYGEFTGDNAVVLCHALTTGQHAASLGSPSRTGSSDTESYREPTAWWDELVGPGKPIDTDEYCVICANAPGSCYGSSGPTSTDPATGEPYGPSFPSTRLEDWTDTQLRLLDQLGIDRVHAVIGGSIGGMNALDWAKRYPKRVEKVLPIAATPRLDAQSLAFDALARRAITADPNWNGGDYYGGPHPDQGLQLARELGLIRYLSRETLAGNYGTDPTTRDVSRPFPPGPYADDAPYRSIESFLDSQANAFVTRFDANSYLSLLRALDEFDLAAGYGASSDALAGFDGEALLLSFTGDWYFPVEASGRLERTFRAADVPVVHRTIQSPYGHDTFLAKPELIAPAIEAFLTEGHSGLVATEHPTDTGADEVW